MYDPGPDPAVPPSSFPGRYGPEAVPSRSSPSPPPSLLWPCGGGFVDFPSGVWCVVLGPPAGDPGLSSLLEEDHPSSIPSLWGGLWTLGLVRRAGEGGEETEWTVGSWPWIIYTCETTVCTCKSKCFFCGSVLVFLVVDVLANECVYVCGTVRLCEWVHAKV